MANFFLGDFQVGDTSISPGDTVVARSIALSELVAFVSANYRLNGTISLELNGHLSCFSTSEVHQPIANFDPKQSSHHSTQWIFIGSHKEER